MAEVFSAFVALGPPPYSYFLSIPGKGWNGASIRGDELQNLMDRLQVESSGAKIHCLAFGQEGSHFVIYKEPDPDRTSKLQNLGISNFYPTLNTWLQSLGQGWKAQDLYVVLGPRGSWWGWSEHVGQKSYKINPVAEDRLKKYGAYADDTPRVCLGRGDNFVIWTEKGYCKWDLKNYPGAEEWLKENLLKHKGRKMVAASLSIFEEGVYFFLLSNGAAHWNVTDPNLYKKVGGFVEKWQRQQRGFIAGEVTGRRAF